MPVAPPIGLQLPWFGRWRAGWRANLLEEARLGPKRGRWL
jgi:hypothetical protein